MAQPLLALDVKPIQTPTYGDIMQERDAYRAQQNALAQQQLKQQQNAMLNQAYAAAYDPQTGRVDQAKLYGALAQGGMGAQIPGQMEAIGKGVEATGKGASEQLKYTQALVDDMHNALGGSRNRDEALANGAMLMQKYPEIAQQLRQELAAIPADPSQFAQWHEQQLRATMDAKDQLEQHYQSQNLGGSTRVLAMPKYGTGGAMVVPGSEAQVTLSPAQANPAGHVVQDANGNYFTVNPRTGAATPVTVGGGGIPSGRGGVDPEAFKAAVVQKESGGNYTAVSPKGALGAYQIMPETAKTLAGRLGLPWNPALMRSNTPEGRQYQDAIGNAAVQEALQASGGDPARAAAYYHGGSDTSKWGPKTQSYAQDVVANMGRAPAAAPTAAPGQLAGRVPGKTPAAATPATPASPNAAPKADPEMAMAVRHLYDLIEEAQKKGHLTSNKQSWVANRLQEATVGRPWLPGGVEQKTSLDKIDKTAKQIMRLSIKPGTSGTLRAVAEQQMFLQSVGGGDASYETRLDAVREFAKQHGISLPEPQKKTPPAANIGAPPPGVSAAEWQHMTPEERKLWAK